MNPTSKVHSHRLRKPTGKAIVVLDGRMYYLGRYQSIESRAEYDRLIAEWKAQGAVTPPPRASSPARPRPT